MPLFYPQVTHQIGGNTAGATANISSGTYVLAGGNNITLSQNANSVTISAAGGGGSQTHGMSNLGNTSGTSGVVSGSAVRYLFAGGNNITLSQSLDAGNVSGTVTISAAAQTNPTLSYWNNLVGSQAVQVLPQDGIFILQHLNQGVVFPGNMTANTVDISMSVASNAVSATSAHSLTFKMGIYTINGVSLSLQNSVSSTWGFSANANNTQLYIGRRQLTIASSQWSSQPVFTLGGQYYAGIQINSATNGAAAATYAFIGSQNRAANITMSGTIGVSLTSGNTSMGQIPWQGQSLSSRDGTAALPTNIQLSELDHVTASGLSFPLIQFNNISSNF